MSPEGWPHQVYNPGATIALSYNYVDVHNFDAYMDFTHLDSMREFEDSAEKLVRIGTTLQIPSLSFI